MGGGFSGLRSLLRRLVLLFHRHNMMRKWRFREVAHVPKVTQREGKAGLVSALPHSEPSQASPLRSLHQYWVCQMKSLLPSMSCHLKGSHTGPRVGSQAALWELFGAQALLGTSAHCQSREQMPSSGNRWGLVLMTA